MDVSVILVTRNTCAQTIRAIESVLADKGTLAVEILVVDNASTDETPRELQKHFPNVCYSRMERNVGFARAVNFAAREARGEFLLLLNSDARLKPGALELATSYLKAHPECGVAGGQLLHEDGRKQNSIANFPSLATELLNKYLLRSFWPERFPGKEHHFTGPIVVETVIGAFFLTRRDLWERLHGMDERFFFFFEETDYCFRVTKAGGTVVHIPQVEVRHGQGETARQNLAGARIEYWKSRYAYFAKHAGPIHCAMLRAGLLARLSVDTAVSVGLTAATLGRSPKWNGKFAVHKALWGWHLQGCPADMGLEK